MGGTPKQDLTSVPALIKIYIPSAKSLLRLTLDVAMY